MYVKQKIMAIIKIIFYHQFRLYVGIKKIMRLVTLTMKLDETLNLTKLKKFIILYYFIVI